MVPKRWPASPLEWSLCHHQAVNHSSLTWHELLQSFTPALLMSYLNTNHRTVALIEVRGLLCLMKAYGHVGTISKLYQFLRLQHNFQPQSFRVNPCGSFWVSAQQYDPVDSTNGLTHYKQHTVNTRRDIINY